MSAPPDTAHEQRFEPGFEPGFEPDVAADIVGHMNDDHADAVLAIARAQGGARTATAATLVAISPHALDIDVVAPRDAGGTHGVRVPIEPPIAPLDTVRARLVGMTKAARTALLGSEGLE